MAHQISFDGQGRAEMAYSGETPWHGLGTKVDGLQTATQILEAARLNWDVELAPVYLADASEVGMGAPIRYQAIPGYQAIRRADKGLTFGVVSDRYRAIQNREAGDIADALVTEGGAHFEVAGALDDGRRCWMLAKLPEAFEVVSGDKVGWYFLLCWGHDGKHGVAGKLTPIRVVCNNTLTAAGFGGGAKWSQSAEVYIRHSAKAKVNIDEARRALGLVTRQAETVGQAFQAMAATKLEAPRDYFEAVIPRPRDTAEAVVTREQLERWEAQQGAVWGLYQAGRGVTIPGVGGTVWAGYNALTEWVDHVYPVLQSGQVSKLRQASVLFGGYESIKTRAASEGMALVAAAVEAGA